MPQCENLWSHPTLSARPRKSERVPGLRFSTLCFFSGQRTALGSGPQGQSPGGLTSHSRAEPFLWSPGVQSRQRLSPSTCQPQFRFPCAPVRELGASTAGGPDRVSVSGLDRICPHSLSHPTLPQVLSVKSEELRPKEQVLAGTEVRQLVNSAPQEAWR